MMEKRNFGWWFAAFIFSFFLIGVCNGQSSKKIKKKELKEIQNLINNGNNTAAQLRVMTLLNRDSNNTEANFLMGLAYFNDLSKKSLCEPYFKKSLGAADNKSAYYMGLFYSSIEKFNDAERFLTIARNKKVSDITLADIDFQLNCLHRARDYYDNPQEYEIENLGPLVNSEKNEHFPWISYDQKTLYFISDKDVTNKAKEKKVYFTEMAEESWRGSIRVNQQEENDRHIEILQWASLGTTYVEDLSEKNSKEKREDSKKGELQWIKYPASNSKIPIGFLEASACVSKDNNMMFFSAKKSEGLGGKDIYLVKKLPNGLWANPQNLGKLVNSSKDEESPFFHEESRTLYFASRGHESIGGFDIFKVKLDENYLPEAREHFQYPLNSSANELEMSVNNSNEIGYFVSDRPGGLGGLDLFSSWISVEARLPSVIKGVVTDEDSKNPIIATITLIQQETQEVHGVFATREDNGTCIILLERGKTYEYYIESDGYITHEGKLTEALSNISEKGNWSVSLQKEN